MASRRKNSEVCFADANGIRIAYDTFGKPSAPPMLLIMGLACQMIIWDDEFCTRLAERGYWVIRFDNRDIGQSQKFDSAGVPDISELIAAQINRAPLKAPYTLSDMAADAVGLLDALEIQSAHVVGASMGGMIAQLMALEYPHRVRTLTSILSSTGDPNLPPPKPEGLQVLYAPLPTDRQGFIEAYMEVWRILSGPKHPVSDSLAMNYAERTFERGLNPEGVIRQYAAILASGSRKEALAGLEVPALVIHGDQDPLVPVECGIDTAEAIPGARLVIIEGMGHAFPEALWPRIIDEIANHAT